MFFRVRTRADYAHVTVDPSWSTFDQFLADMGERPHGTTLDREDGTMGYGPANCRWATSTQQNRNRKDNVVIEYDGKFMCINAWAEHRGINKHTLKARIRNGWPTAKALGYVESIS